MNELKILKVRFLSSILQETREECIADYILTKRNLVLKQHWKLDTCRFIHDILLYYLAGKEINLNLLNLWFLKIQKDIYFAELFCDRNWPVIPIVAGPNICKLREL